MSPIGAGSLRGPSELRRGAPAGSKASWRAVLSALLSVPSLKNRTFKLLPAEWTEPGQSNLSSLARPGLTSVDVSIRARKFVQTEAPPTRPGAGTKTIISPRTRSRFIISCEMRDGGAACRWPRAARVSHFSPSNCPHPDRCAAGDVWGRQAPSDCLHVAHARKRGSESEFRGPTVGRHYIQSQRAFER